MIQDKNSLLRRIKEVSGILNELIGSFPDNSLGITQADIEQQIYTATGFSSDHFLQASNLDLEAIVDQKGNENRSLFLDFFGNLFYQKYQQTGEKAYLSKAQEMYRNFQKESKTFSMVYFQRMQENA